jgi:two-component SAPR family response regulator
MKNKTGFMIIDDDIINNTLCSVIIKRLMGPDTFIRTFNNPEKGFHFITEEANQENPLLIFLDINMPGWSGWTFLENFEKLDESIKQRIKIYMLSSSLDSSDKHKAYVNKNVVGFIIKPLTKTKLISILEEHNTLASRAS